MMYARNLITVAVILGMLSIPMIAVGSGPADRYGTGLDRPYVLAQAPSAAPEEGKGEPGFGRRGHHGKWQAIKKELGLTPEQTEKLRALKQESREKMKSVRDSVRKIHEEKLAMLRSGKIDQAQLAKLDQELVKYRTEMMTERLRMKRARLEVLNPDQIKKVGEFIAKKHEEHKMMRERRHGEDK